MTDLHATLVEEMENAVETALPSLSPEDRAFLVAASLAALQSVLSARGAKVVSGEATGPMRATIAAEVLRPDWTVERIWTAALSAAPDLLSSEGV